MTAPRWRAHTFHQQTRVSATRVADDVLQVETVCYQGQQWYRVWPCDGRASGVKGGSLVAPSPVTRTQDDADAAS